MRRYLSPLLLLIFAIFLLTFFALRNKTPHASAELAAHVVISEIQIEGATSSDEFVELYNPTDGIVDLAGWSLYRKTAATASAEILLATMSGTIAPHGFLLIANTGYDGTVSGDLIYSGQNISDNNTVLLRDTSSLLIDLVGMGTAGVSETATVLNPIDNRSIERKALSTSTEADMSSSGAHFLLGNGEDTDNNGSDFVRHVAPNSSDPQNSLSQEEPELTPTPSPTPSASPSPTEEPTPTPSPTPTPTPTEEPTPTPTPTSEPSPTPSLTPSLTPTNSPTPSLSPTPTPRIIASWPNFTCFLSYNTIRIMGFQIKIPSIKCMRI